MKVPDISVRNLRFGFGDKVIFENFSLELGAGGAGGLAGKDGGPPAVSGPPQERDNPLVILGPSGCGKTTLLRLLAGLLRPWSGEIETAPPAGETGLCSFVFQEPRLLPWKTALENASLPIERLLGKREARERAGHCLDMVSLGDFREAFPEELSGGQKQRVSIARAFACPGPFLLMDEPFQSLDIPLRRNLLDLTKKLLESEPRRLVAASHDPGEALYLGRRVIVLGQAPRGIVLDLAVGEKLPPAERAELEERILSVLSQGFAAE
ncbi:MAG: ATP-binding cassette domain-containing protein [Treponema sp.]|jgi:NitT/TauT family transport system ATP-binding protein|nr:ATP-binding cassette domain-containing protein [Treponema sp.]